MKAKLFFVIAIIVTCLQVACDAQQWRADRYDSRWIPITSAQMSKEVKANAQDEIALYRLWWRAIYQDQQEAYFSSLRQIKLTQPKNGKALSVYCSVLMESNRLYGVGFYKFRVNPQEGTREQIRQNLSKAEALSPKLWLNPLTEADFILVFNTVSQDEISQAVISLCRESVRRAPQLSFPNARLGHALANESMAKKKGYGEAIRFYKKAQSLLPVTASPSFLLLYVNRSYAPNSVEAAKALQAIAKTIPPGTNLSARTKQLMAKQNIVLPYKN